ncbi:MAG TPA: response regulator transcription factor [Candidatus Tectomicrobia bacterium]|nr:response regulator transcription factor [Candidatus Tectomicrobia bacterium]
MIRVLIAASSEIVGAGLQALLASHPILLTVGRWQDMASLASQVEAQLPDVVLLELELPDDDSLAVVEALVADPHPPALVVLTDDAHGTWATEALRAGVRAILPRQAHASEIVAAIAAAAAGLVALHRDMIESLLPMLSSAPRGLPGSSQQALTPREIEVLSMLAEGLGNKAIAWRLGISEHTVKFHLGSIFIKLNASSRTEAVTLGIRLGLIMV